MESSYTMGNLCFRGNILDFWNWGPFTGIGLPPLPWRISSFGR